MCSWPAHIISAEEFVTVDTAEDTTKLALAFAGLNEPFLFNEDKDNDKDKDKDTTTTTSTTATTATRSDRQENNEHNGHNEHNEHNGHNINKKISTAHGSPLVFEGDTVISFSHFLPRQELCPEKRFLLEPMLARVIGSNPLEAQIRRLKPHVHCFGHTHIPIDLSLDGIRYLQWSLGYSSESDKQCAPVYERGALCIYDSVLGTGEDGFPADSPSVDASWSAYYMMNMRKPHITDVLSPWLQRRLDSFSGLVSSSLKGKKSEST